MSSRPSVLLSRDIDSFTKISCRMEFKLHHTMASSRVLMGLPSIMDGIALNCDLHSVRALCILFGNVITESFRGFLQRSVGIISVKGCGEEELIILNVSGG